MFVYHLRMKIVNLWILCLSTLTSCSALLGSIWSKWVCGASGMEDHGRAHKPIRTRRFWSHGASQSIWKNYQRSKGTECQNAAQSGTVRSRMQRWGETPLATYQRITETESGMPIYFTIPKSLSKDVKVVPIHITWKFTFRLENKLTFTLEEVCPMYSVLYKGDGFCT